MKPIDYEKDLIDLFVRQFTQLHLDAVREALIRWKNSGRILAKTLPIEVLEALNAGNFGKRNSLADVLHRILPIMVGHHVAQEIRIRITDWVGLMIDEVDGVETYGEVQV